MKIDSNITHTPRAMPTNAILTIGTDTARVPSPFNNLRAIKNSKFKSLHFYSSYKSIIFHSIRQNQRILFHKSLYFLFPRQTLPFSSQSIYHRTSHTACRDGSKHTIRARESITKVKILKIRKKSKPAHSNRLCAILSNWNFIPYPMIVKECAKNFLTFSTDVKSSGQNEKLQVLILRV